MLVNKIATAIAIFCFCTISVSAQCGYNASGSSGSITSPNYPSNYGNNLNCDYTITTPENTVAFLEILDLHLVGTNDYVSIYNGPSAEDDQLIGTYSNDQAHVAINGSTNQVLVRFVSDDSSTLKGFNITFIAKDAGPCGGVVSGSSGYVHSPNYPNKYENGMDCYYTLSTTEGTALSLDIVNVDLETGCDYVKVYDGPTADSRLLKLLTGSEDGQAFASTNQLLVHFHSDISMSYTGFEINFTERAPCGYDVSGASGEITSPGYPLGYPRNLNCYYKITTSEGTTVALDIVNMALETWYDFIQIFDGSSPGSTFAAMYSGQHSNSSYYASSNEVTIYFHSDASGSPSLDKGFHISYYEMDASPDAM